MNKANRKRIRKLSKQIKKKGGLYETRKPKLGHKKLYMITEANFEYHIIEQILLLNDIEITDVVIANEYGTIMGDFSLNKKFKEASRFDWSMEYPLMTDDAEFRGKFLTLLLFWILDNTEKIIDNVYSFYPNKKEGKLKRKVLKTILTRIDLFVVNFGNRDYSYSDTMVDILDLTILKSGSDNIAKIIEKYTTQLAFLKDAFQNGEYSEALIWHNVIRLAYMMCTNNTNFRNLPEYNDKLDLTNPDVVKDAIGRLGVAICIQQKKKKPILYRLWLKANPDVLSSFPDVNDCIELRVGTKALHYLMFLADNKELNSWLEEIL